MLYPERQNRKENVFYTFCSALSRVYKDRRVVEGNARIKGKR